jgi:hypothetical protein
MLLSIVELGEIELIIAWFLRYFGRLQGRSLAGIGLIVCDLLLVQLRQKLIILDAKMLRITQHLQNLKL